MSSLPVIRERPAHCISRRNIDPDALKVMYRLVQRGYIAYLVGGGVRDLLLGRKPKDFDVGTNAHPRELKRIFRNCFLIGRRFRLAHIKYGDKIIETSTFRRAPPKDEVTAEGVHPHSENTFGTPEEDALRRDFTINGLFYDIETYRVIDYVGGLEDLEKRIIRSIGDPNIRFLEDPVRMIRAVRFASRLGFTIEPGTYEAILLHHREILKASPPRLLEEIYRLFPYRSACAAFRLLRETKLLSVLFPELDRLLDRAGEDDSFWRYLTALDQGDETLPLDLPAIQFGTLYYSLFQQRRYEEEGRPIHEIVTSLYRPLTQRLPIPRRVVDMLIRITIAQDHFQPLRRKRFSKHRFVQQPYFREALALYQIHCMATGEDLTSVDPWRHLYEAIHPRLETRDVGGTPPTSVRKRASGREEGEGTKKREKRARRKKKRRTPQPESETSTLLHSMHEGKNEKERVCNASPTNLLMWNPEGEDLHPNPTFAQ